MLDIALIREKPDWVREQLKNLNDIDAIERIGTILDLDQGRRELLQESETLQSARNKLNKGMGQLRGNKQLVESVRIVRAFHCATAVKTGDYDRAEAILTGQHDSEVLPDGLSLDKALESLTHELREMGAQYNLQQEQIKRLEAELTDNMLWIPNMPHESVPVADSEESNVAWEPEGVFREFDFEPKPHWELGPELGIIDFERGVKVAGSRAYMLHGWGAHLQRALTNFFLDMARKKGFVEMYLPFFVQEEMLYGSAQLPKFRDVVYVDPDADVYMLPTAEVGLTNIHRDEILDERQLPLNYVAHTPCFRRERMSAGRDVRGIKRVHQFEKVEMYKFTTPETSYDELELLTESAADLCRALQLPFRRLEIVTGDLGFSASKKYDLEVWSPGCREWLEVSSCSNTEDFQARRANIRYRKEGVKKPLFVHTLNGSGLALPRVIIAIMENYQHEDGSIVIPEVLRAYVGDAELITEDN